MPGLGKISTFGLIVTIAVGVALVAHLIQNGSNVEPVTNAGIERIQGRKRRNSRNSRNSRNARYKSDSDSDTSSEESSGSVPESQWFHNEQGVYTRITGAVAHNYTKNVKKDLENDIAKVKKTIKGQNSTIEDIKKNQKNDFAFWQGELKYQDNRLDRFQEQVRSNESELDTQRTQLQNNAQGITNVLNIQDGLGQNINQVSTNVNTIRTNVQALQETLNQVDGRLTRLEAWKIATFEDDNKQNDQN